jgi:hypothetical protein
VEYLAENIELKKEIIKLKQYDNKVINEEQQNKTKSKNMKVLGLDYNSSFVTSPPVSPRKEKNNEIDFITRLVIII